MASFNFPTLNAKETGFPRQLTLNSILFYHTMDHHDERELHYIRITNPSQTSEGDQQYTFEDREFGPQSRSWGTRVEGLPYSFGNGLITAEDGSQIYSSLIIRKVDDAPGQFEVAVKK